MTVPKKIVILSDGKPGHENQSLALAEALARRTKADFQVLPPDQTPSFRPDLLIAAGHKTHLKLLWLGCRYSCPTVVVMKPSLPSALFSKIIAPQHDYFGQKPARNVFLTEGSLCRLPEHLPPKKDQGLLLFGGPSKHYSWETPALAAQLEVILSRGELNWKIADSRRTPESTRRVLQSYFRQYVPHEQTTPQWLPGELAQSKLVWVTRDSVSMLYEALTAGAGVGVFDLPLRAGETRITQSVSRLIEVGRVRSFSQSASGSQEGGVQNQPFHEAARCAEYLLAQKSFEGPTPRSKLYSVQ